MELDKYLQKTTDKWTLPMEERKCYLQEFKSAELFMCKLIYDMFFSISHNTGSLPLAVCNVAFLWIAREILK